MVNALSIANLCVTVDKKPILKDVSCEITSGQVHVLMGPNGSGKSSLAYTIMGHPRYVVQSGCLQAFGEDILTESPDKRARRGIFLATQNPVEIEGVSIRDFLRHAYQTLHPKSPYLSPKAFMSYLEKQLDILNIPLREVERSINVGCSGGEKKKLEMLQLLVLQPKIAILDEIDSGLDIDALKTVCETLQQVKNTIHDLSLIVITHNPRVFDFITPDVVHLIQQGRITETGDVSLIEKIALLGFDHEK